MTFIIINIRLASKIKTKTNNANCNNNAHIDAQDEKRSGEKHVHFNIL